MLINSKALLMQKSIEATEKISKTIEPKAKRLNNIITNANRTYIIMLYKRVTHCYWF
jgi:hypothetical protein